MGRTFILATITAATLAAAGSGVLAAPGQLTVELNKFEQNDNGNCSAFFLFRNETEKSFDGFQMSLAVLDQNGVIDRLLSINAAPLPSARTILKVFEIPDTTCTDVSEILLHEMTSCKPQNEAETDCFPFLKLDSKASAGLVK